MTISHESFTLERIYPNCRDHVWSAWSDPMKKSKWLGAPLETFDFRSGGGERSRFRDQMGEHVNEGHYFEIDPGRRIVLAYSMAMNGRVHTASLATIVLSDEGGGTRLTYTEQMCVIPPSDGVAGRRRGWEELLDGIAPVLAAEAGQR